MNEITPALDNACLWFVEGVLNSRRYTEHDWLGGFYIGRRETAKYIIQSGLTQDNRRAIGQTIASKIRILK